MRPTTGQPRHLRTRPIASTSPASGVSEESTIPQKGLSAVPLVEAIHDGKIKGLLPICFNPTVSLPDGDFVREALEKLEFYVVIDFFMSETRSVR